MLDEGQRREALGVGLIMLGLLAGLALISPEVADGRNWIGPAGALLHRGLTFVLGPLAPLLAISAFIWGAHFLGWGDSGRVIRASLLPACLVLVLPTLLWVSLSRDAATTAEVGWLGETIGTGLQSAFGWVGALLISATLLIMGFVLTLGRSLTQTVAGGGRAARRGLSAGSGSARTLAGAIADLYRSDGESTAPWADVRAEPVKAEPVGETASPKPRVRKKKKKVRKVAEDKKATVKNALAPVVPTLDDPGDLDQTDLPPLELLKQPDVRSSGLAVGDLDRLGNVLIEKLATFRIAGEIGGWTTGPVVTQFEVVPAPGVKVGSIAARADDIALALKAPSVRIVAPIPGKGAVGVEVPNPAPEMVRLREVIGSPDYRRTRMLLPIALGRDLSGQPYCADLTRMPHLLIAGQTGSGKSVCINTLITSLIYRYTPADLRLLMVDPKMVELSVYGDLPHLRHPVITDNDEAASVLKWAVYEMKRRFGLLSANGCRNLEEFNARLAKGKEVVRPKLPGSVSDPLPYEEGRLPFVVLIIDELADLMMTVQADVETPLAMLAQKARAVGIHLVLATQRPSVNVLTGLIKANIPSRIAFRVASKIDSRTILDGNGAESLLGNGDMLFLPPGKSDPVRIQGAFIDSAETERVLDWYREEAKARALVEAAEERDILDVVKEIEDASKVEMSDAAAEDRDALFRQAAEIVIANSAGSTSLLQRRLKIGYGRAARIIDQLHYAGVVGPAEGSKPREVLLSLIDLEDGLSEN